MIRLIKITLLFLFAVGTGADAQNRWYIEPAASFAASTKDNSGLRLGLTVGRYIGGDDMRVDIQGNYYFMDETKDWYSLSALFSLDSELFGSRKFHGTSSLGVGYLYSRAIDNGVEKKYNDVIIPLKFGAGYEVLPRVSVGVELAYNFNISAFKQRSVMYTGVTVGFRF